MPKFGELLCDSGAISHLQLTQALNLQEQRGGRLGEVLVDLGYLTTDSLVAALQKKHQVRAVDLASLKIPSPVQKLISLEKMERHQVVPLDVDDQTLYLAMADPGDLDLVKELEFSLSLNVKPIAAPSSQIKAVLRSLKENGGWTDQPLHLRELCVPRPPATSCLQSPPLQELLRRLVEECGSDLLMSPGAPASLKINGELIRLPYSTLTPQMTVQYAREMMTGGQWAEFEQTREQEFSYTIPRTGRFRVNAYLQRGSIALSIRATIEEIPSLSELGLPGWLREHALRPNGLILISAPNGHGKTTTLAALVDLINTMRKANIVTIEEPIEYHHRHKLSNVNQREVGVDTESFHEGLKRLFRQAPDVIVIGEIRDQESAAIAVQAASTGHLVLSTLHASNSTTTIERLIDIFPPNHQHQIRSQLAESLLLVLDQRLIPRKDGKGRVLAYEKLVNSHRVRAMIREGKTSQIRTLLGQGADDFQCLDNMLAQLCREGRISKDDALKHCENRSFLLDAVARGSLRN